VKHRKPRSSSRKKELGKYKSSLELETAKLLSESGLSYFYEEVEYTLVDKVTYGGVYYKMTEKSKGLTNRSGSVVLPIKYTPDFVAKDGSWIIEIKGFLTSHHDFPMRWKLFLKHLVDSEKPLPAVFICKNKAQVEMAIKIIKDGEIK
jgi:hypothetical protein